MKPEKRQALDEAGWVFGDAEDFLQLDPVERELVELRLAVSRAVQERRRRARLTQAAAAKILETSQPRFANIEAAAQGVSLDLMFRALYGLGGTIDDVSAAARGKPKVARAA